MLINPLNNEKWVCEDYTDVKTVDGVEFIHVNREFETRKFLMRKDALSKLRNS